MKDVFEELKVLVGKGKSRTSQINKDILETVFNNFYKYKHVIA